MSKIKKKAIFETYVICKNLGSACFNTIFEIFIFFAQLVKIFHYGSTWATLCIAY